MMRKLGFAVGLMLLTGCGLGQAQGVIVNRTVQVNPNEPRIGSSFTLVVNQALDPSSASLAPIPDGEYAVLLSTAVHVQPTNGDNTVPTTQATPYNDPKANIGTISIKDGKGQGDFVLQADYGNGVKPSVGGPVTVNFSNASYTGTVGFYVGK